MCSKIRAELVSQTKRGHMSPKVGKGWYAVGTWCQSLLIFADPSQTLLIFDMFCRLVLDLVGNSKS